MEFPIIEILEDGTTPVGVRDGVLITWNRSATFNVYAQRDHTGSIWEEVDVFTRYGVETLEQAREAAADHLTDVPEDGI